MAKINKLTPATPVFTHEGAKAAHATPYQQLRRSVMATLLWEAQFYEDGVEIAERIKQLVHACDVEQVAFLAVEAREQMKLRHVPLLLLRELVRHKNKDEVNVANFFPLVCQRADEMAEFLALYWAEKKDAPIPAAVKRGLSACFHKFDEYQFAKYNREADIKLRDVMFLVHPKPANEEQAALFKRIAEDKLASPETWENKLSRGEDKKGTFEALIREGKLGAMALLRNLRGMREAGVDQDLVRSAIGNMKAERVLPFRFISAAKFAPNLEPELETAMFKCLEGAEKLKGRSLLLVDVSGSMDSAISDKSDLTRIDAACGLGMLLREVCDSVDIFTFSASLKQVPSRRGFALRDAILGSQPHASTLLGNALAALNYGLGYQRVIVITDEQSHDKVSSPNTKGYMLNVASYKNGVGYGKWTTIDGWSEACVRYVSEVESAL